ncbi:auxin-responsive protein SAUR71-like [Phragmites australis]|uniref:auxin-responsive protein SAUR71-like n=1 Tax=Phragmites australis TaxID=29695 RepID=UPI002D76BC4D|nr:auxin-responsive protein SAUR71-like [Phragmites australis]
MKRLLRRLSRSFAAAEDGHTVAGVAMAAHRRRQLRPKKDRAAGSLPEGHVPVCVGEEGGPVERFAVRAELLGEPAFAALLRQAAQEYGYGHPGALRIPCPVAEFRRLLLRLSDDPAAAACRRMLAR